MTTRNEALRKPDETDISLAKTLIRSARHGALAVLDRQTGGPLASRVAVATDVDGAPVILVSSLSAHTSALRSDSRCSLLLGEPGKGDPLSYPRDTLVCRATVLERGTLPQARTERRYLAHHPKARLYAGFGDFSYVPLEPESANLNGGFGKACRLERGDLVIEGPAVDALAAIEEGAIAHMNEEHSDAIQLYARYFGGVSDHLGAWRMAGLDVEGLDLAAGDAVLRILYPDPLRDAAGLRLTLSDMAKQARQSLGTT